MYELIGANRLGRLLEPHSDTLRLVLLNTCDSAKIRNGNVLSSIASILLRRGVVSVVAMQQKITDKAAKKFAQAFYSSLADGMPIEASMSEAHMSMADGKLNALEWGIPVLYMRSSSNNLFTPRELAANAQVLPTIKERSNNSTIRGNANYQTASITKKDIDWVRGGRRGSRVRSTGSTLPIKPGISRNDDLSYLRRYIDKVRYEITGYPKKGFFKKNIWLFLIIILVTDVLSLPILILKLFKISQVAFFVVSIFMFFAVFVWGTFNSDEVVGIIANIFYFFIWVLIGYLYMQQNITYLFIVIVANICLSFIRYQFFRSHSNRR